MKAHGKAKGEIEAAGGGASREKQTRGEKPGESDFLYEALRSVQGGLPHGAALPGDGNSYSCVGASSSSRSERLNTSTARASTSPTIAGSVGSLFPRSLLMSSLSSSLVVAMLDATSRALPLEESFLRIVVAPPRNPRGTGLCLRLVP
jgi:hypothetical protein